MGLIMLILIGTVPTAYALNRALPENQVASFVRSSLAASKVVETKAAGYNVLGDPRPAVTFPWRQFQRRHPGHKSYAVCRSFRRR